MSTTYTVDISASDGSEGTLEIDISLLPGQSTWVAVTKGMFSEDNGPVLDHQKLMGLGVTPIAFLTDFPDKKNGKGGKNDPDSSLPQGDFDWSIKKQD